MNTLADCVGGSKRVVGGPFGSNLTQADYTLTGVPVIRGTNMEALGRWVGGNFVFVASEKANTSLRTNVAHGGDIIVTQRGTLGQVSIIPDDIGYDQFIISQSQMRISVDPDFADRDFVYYYLRSPFFLEYLQNATIQVGVPHINLRILRSALVDWPKPTVQREIGSALSLFDEKIELNLQTNIALEALAQATFLDWFVNFGPVRRKLEGATDPIVILGGLIVDPAQALELAGMFPTALDVQGIPLGWTRSPLEALLTLAYGKALPKTVRTEGNVPVYGSGGLGGTHNAALVTGPGIVVGRKGTVGSLYWEPQAFYPIDTVFYVKPKPNFSLHFLWQLLQTLELETMNSDAAVPGLNRNNVHRLDVVRATQPILDAFDCLASVLRSSIDANNAENNTLVKTRDYLLPRLISGKVRVADAQRMAV